MEILGFVIVLILLLLALALAAGITAGISALTGILDPGDTPAPGPDPD